MSQRYSVDDRRVSNHLGNSPSRTGSYSKFLTKTPHKSIHYTEERKSLLRTLFGGLFKLWLIYWIFHLILIGAAVWLILFLTNPILIGGITIAILGIFFKTKNNSKVQPVETTPIEENSNRTQLQTSTHNSNVRIIRSSNYPQLPSREFSPNCKDCGTTIDYFDKFCINCGIKINWCIVCRKEIMRSDLVLSCPSCQRAFHKEHIQEWLKVKGMCPSCGERLSEKFLQ